MIRQKLLHVILWVRKFIREKFHSSNEDLPYYVTILAAAIIFAVALTSFVQLTDELAENELGDVDQSVTEYVVSFRSETLTRYLTFVTHLGDRYTYIIITLLLAAYFFIRHRSWKFILQTTLVLILATLSNIALKDAINRARPSHEHLVSVSTLSYPSGHSMSAMAFYGFLIYLCLRYNTSRPLKYVIVIFLGLLIVSIGLSRIYLGVHFPTDVAGGFVGGAIWVAFCAVVFNVFELLRKRQRASA